MRSHGSAGRWLCGTETHDLFSYLNKEDHPRTAPFLMEHLISDAILAIFAQTLHSRHRGVQCTAFWPTRGATRCYGEGSMNSIYLERRLVSKAKFTPDIL
ncbi:hypothetical protein C8Q74DRAFT_130990 [Fomes fomentarius]|nr:hypothetical protein C8Q74DRAFT_130990 [Fomes fomentarius]